MHIQYFGLSSFKITTKDATVIIDPFSKDSGLTPPRGGADIVILSEKNNPLYSATSGITGEPFLIPDPGEYDLKGVTITGIPVKQDEKYQIIFLIESEDIKILSLGHIADFTIKQDELESLGSIDVVLLPVGGMGVFEPDQAAKVVNQVEASLVIPTHYQIPGLTLKAGNVEKFVKEMGGKAESSEKLILKKKDIPSEGTKVITLEPLR
jgi:L-ascorbate metabolism protein UlaG (beta-lactamase superfamily)